LVLAIVGGAAAGHAAAQSIAVSIGVRETGSMAALGQDGGTDGGIEWVDRDANVISLDGSWQQVSFNLSNAQLLAFAGITANSMWDGTRGVLDHLRLRNTDGLTGPLRLYIDDLTLTGPGQPNFTDGWEGPALGAEHIFRDPGFSGSTMANLLGTGSSAVSAAMARTGAQSYEMNLQFVDNDPTRWARVQTWDTITGGNPTVDFGGTVSFWIKGEVVPAPGTGAMLMIAGVAGLRRRR
jgi:hypothetical protein